MVQTIAVPALGFACSLILSGHSLYDGLHGSLSPLIEFALHSQSGTKVERGALSFSVNTSMAFGVVLHIIRDMYHSLDSV